MQNQQRRFSDPAPEQPVYRFPRNQQLYGGQTQQQVPADSASRISEKTNSGTFKKSPTHCKRRKIFTLWNLFAVIGILTTIIQLARYVVIPLLVYLQSITGGLQ